MTCTRESERERKREARIVPFTSRAGCEAKKARKIAGRTRLFGAKRVCNIELLNDKGARARVCVCVGTIVEIIVHLGRAKVTAMTTKPAFI